MKPQPTIAQIERKKISRVLTISDVFAIGYGDLGSSIYYALGITAFYALGATPIALLLAGFVFACTALTYAEMSSMDIGNGGSVGFSRYAFNDLVSFIAGWALLLDFIVTIAISAYSVAPYLSYFFPLLSATPWKIAFTIGLIGTLLAVNIFGARHSTRLSWILTGLTLATQLVIIGISSFYTLEIKEVIHHLWINRGDIQWSPTWNQFWKGMAMAMVAYTGIESMAQLGSEAKNPARTVPRAMMWSMGVLLVMYLLISMVAFSALTPQELSVTYNGHPLAGIIAKLPFWNHILGPWVGILAATLLAVAANAGLMGASRVASRMGELYQIPRVFYKLHPKRRTPYVSLTIFAACAALIVLWSRGNLAFLADLYNFGAMLAFFLAHLSLIIIRIKKPELERPFRIPFNIPLFGQKIPVSALIGVIATFGTWLLVVWTKPDGRYLGLIWVVLGTVAYFFYRKREGIAATGHVKIEEVPIPDFEHLNFKKILVATRGGNTSTVQVACELAKLHGASLVIVSVIDVPFSLSLDVSLEKRVSLGEVCLKRAEAIAREYGIPAELKLIRARLVTQALMEVVQSEEIDLLVAGTQLGKKKLSEMANEIIEKVPCRTFIVSNGPLR